MKTGYQELQIETFRFYFEYEFEFENKFSNRVRVLLVVNAGQQHERVCVLRTN